MLLADSSAWIEMLRATESPADRRLTDCIATDPSRVSTTEPVILGLLAGAPDPRERRRLTALLAGCTQAPVLPADWTAAADLYGRCRARGPTPRGLLDCLIAAIAIRRDLALLAHDRDFELIAQHTELRIAA